MIGEPPMNLVDGEAGARDGDAWFQVGDRFGLAIRGQRAEAMRACSRTDGGRNLARLGIRPENIRVSRTRPGPAAFQLPVYAVVQEAQSTVISFELPETFLYVRTWQEIGAADYRVGEPLWVDIDPEKIFFFPKTVALSSKA
jgi:ABC-type sugar transport system ATPase subunit